MSTSPVMQLDDLIGLDGEWPSWTPSTRRAPSAFQRFLMPLRDGQQVQDRCSPRCQATHRR